MVPKIKQTANQQNPPHEYYKGYNSADFYVKCVSEFC